MFCRLNIILIFSYMSCENIAFVKMVSNPFVYFEYTALKHAY